MSTSKRERLQSSCDCLICRLALDPSGLATALEKITESLSSFAHKSEPLQENHDVQAVISDI